MEQTSLRLFRRRRSRAKARQGRWVSRRSLHLGRGERARRVETRRLCDAGRGRLRHVEAVQPRYGDGIRPGDYPVTLQRTRTGLLSEENRWVNAQRIELEWGVAI